MSWELELVLNCDNGCGDNENYGTDVALHPPYDDIELPDGWKTDYPGPSDAGIFEHICRACVEQFEEEAERSSSSGKATGGQE